MSRDSFSYGIPLSFGGVTITPEQIAAAVAAQTRQPAQTLTQAVTAASQPAPQPTTAVPANATGIAAQELTGDPDMDRQILAARDAQGVSVDVGAGSLTPEEDRAKGPKYLVHFSTEKILPLIGSGEQQDE